jgi:hypothetical protein
LHRYVEGVFPGGFYNERGEWVSGYYDERGNFNEGYYNQMGDWVGAVHKLNSVESWLESNPAPAPPAPPPPLACFQPLIL